MPSQRCLPHPRTRIAVASSNHGAERTRQTISLADSRMIGVIEGLERGSIVALDVTLRKRTKRAHEVAVRCQLVHDTV